MPRTQKDFKPVRLGIFATLGLSRAQRNGLLLTQLNCGIRVEATLIADRAPGNGNSRARASRVLSAYEAGIQPVRNELEHGWLPAAQQLLQIDTESLPILWD